MVLDLDGDGGVRWVAPTCGRFERSFPQAAHARGELEASNAALADELTRVRVACEERVAALAKEKLDLLQQVAALSGGSAEAEALLAAQAEAARVRCMRSVSAGGCCTAVCAMRCAVCGHDADGHTCSSDSHCACVWRVWRMSGGARAAVWSSDGKEAAQPTAGSRLLNVE
jgi:hypothetical protein